jgi:hypothetical protein
MFRTGDPLHRTLSATGQRKTGDDYCYPIYTLRWDPNTYYSTHWYGSMEGFVWSGSQNHCVTTGITDRQDTSWDCVYSGPGDAPGEAAACPDLGGSWFEAGSSSYCSGISQSTCEIRAGHFRRLIRGAIHPVLIRQRQRRHLRPTAVTCSRASRLKHTVLSHARASRPHRLLSSMSLGMVST